MLLDLGGTVFRSGSEMMALLGEAEPATRDVVARRGPLGPERDDLWERMIRSEITERDYWQRRSDEVGGALGRDWPITEFMHLLYAQAGEEIIRPAAAELAADARAAGHKVGVLTNDLRAFHGETAMASHPFLRDVDALVDASVTGILKPDPRAYALGAEALDTDPGDIVFVDDMPWNIEGARKAGMIAVELNLTDPDRAFAEAADALGLRRGTLPSHTVRPASRVSDGGGA